MKRFLFLIYGLSSGGAERVMSVLSSELAERGHEIHLGLYKRTDQDYPLSEKVRIHVLQEKQGENKFRNMLYRIRQVSGLIDEVKPDYVVPFMGTVMTEAYFAARKRSCIFIAAVRVDPMNMGMGALNTWLTMYTYSKADGVFVQNDTQKAYFSEKIQKKTFVVFNPVSEAFLTEKYSPRGEITHIVTSGRLTEQKNQKMLIDATALVARKCPQVHLTIYGQGPMKKLLEEYIASQNLQKNVTLFGRTDQMLAELQKNDLFVLSSNYEGMPNALLEAMALGMPCISTDCRTGPRDMIQPYESGILTPVNDKEQMAQAILFMMENPKNAYEMGRQARIFAKENCEKDKIVDKFLLECDKIRGKNE